LFSCFIVLTTTLGCRKIKTEPENIPTEEIQTNSLKPPSDCDLTTTICEDWQVQEYIDEDTANRPTFLGREYINPYSLRNMTTAFNYVYSNNISQVNTTHYYVRFKPRDVFELNLLDSLDLELYDYPLNYQVLEDGDYWPEAYNGLGQGEHPWLYTVVEQDFRLPDGIQTEILESLHIPNDNQILEDEAFFITGNSECDSSYYTALRQQRRQYYIDHPVEPCEVIDLESCAPGSGGGGHGGTGVSSTQKPNGQIILELM